MPPRAAAIVFAVGILGLIFLDRDRESKPSPAVWLAVVWMAIGASRMVTQWLGVGGAVDSPDAYLEGSPADRLFLIVLLVAGLAVLFSRRERSGAFLRANWPILLSSWTCGLSSLWADFPLVAFKRWTKALGNLVMVLVVLTDLNPGAAVKALFARVGFLLIPCSVLFVKYFPELGRSYDRWVGTAYYTGVGSDKNALGCICLVFGLVAVWRVVHGLRAHPRAIRPLAAQATMLAMVLYLLHLAKSSTSLACFVLGTGLILVTAVRPPRRPAAIHVLVGLLAVGAVAAFTLFDAYGTILEALGRDATLTGRTDLWKSLLDMNQSPLVGAGFESFFLGHRLQELWARYWWHPNEAHDGYIEIYLNLGWVGLTLLFLLVVWGYRNIVRAFSTEPETAGLRLAFLLVILVYNVTEAAFKVMHPVWITLILVIAAAPAARAMARVAQPVGSGVRPAGQPWAAPTPGRTAVRGA